MLSFVVPLAHPLNMRSVSRRAELLNRTVQSLQGQDDAGFEIIVVGVPPALDQLNVGAAVHQVSVEFPPAGGTSEPTLEDVWVDKGAKVAVGVAYARRLGSTHVMSVDSDDYVSRRLAAHVAEHRNSDGWYIPQGYFHISGTRTLISIDEGFHRKCGSSHIISTAVHPVSPTVTPQMSRNEVVARVGELVIVELLGKHRVVPRFLAERGAHLEDLPFRGAVWEIATGENFSRLLSSSGPRAKMTECIADEFGLPVPSLLEHYTNTTLNSIQRVNRRLSNLVPRRSP